MSESRPSNITSNTAVDDKPPVIKHTALKSITNGVGATITATVKDNIGVEGVTLFYLMEGEDNFKSVPLKPQMELIMHTTEVQLNQMLHR